MSEKVIHSRDGARHVYTLADGEEFMFIGHGEFRGSIVVTHPDRAPKLVLCDGSETNLPIEHIEARTSLVALGNVIDMWRDKGGEFE